MYADEDRSAPTAGVGASGRRVVLALAKLARLARVGRAGPRFS